MDFSQLWALVSSLVTEDWQTFLTVFLAIGGLKLVGVVRKDLQAQIANIVASGIASGLFDNYSTRNFFEFVAFSAGTALLYHFSSKIVVPQAKSLAAQLQKK